MEGTSNRRFGGGEGLLPLKLTANPPFFESPKRRNTARLKPQPNQPRPLSGAWSEGRPRVCHVKGGRFLNRVRSNKLFPPKHARPEMAPPGMEKKGFGIEMHFGPTCDTRQQSNPSQVFYLTWFYYTPGTLLGLSTSVFFTFRPQSGWPSL